MWLYHILFIHLPISGDLCCFYLLAIMNRATMNFCVISKCLFESLYSVLLEIYPGVELLDCTVLSMLNFLRNCYPVFSTGCTILHAHQQNISVPVATSLPILVILCCCVFCFFVLLVHLIGTLICTSILSFVDYM